MADMTIEQAWRVLDSGTVTRGRLYFDNDERTRQALATLRAELDGLRGKLRWMEAAARHEMDERDFAMQESSREP